MSRHRPVGDAHDRITFQHLGEDRRTSRIHWDKETQLPRNDLAEQTVSTQPVAHRLGEAGQFDAVGTHYADTAKLERLREIDDYLAIQQRREGGIGREVWRTGFGCGHYPRERNLAADDAFSGISLQPIDARRL